MTRHIFRLTYYKNVEFFLRDGAVFAKNHKPLQRCWRTSYQDIVNRRGTEFWTPDGDNINDYLPFYFSPITPMACAIYKKSVPLKNLDGVDLGAANQEDIVFLVSTAEKIANTPIPFWFSDVACNTMAPQPHYLNDITQIENHIEWRFFEEEPKKAYIPEIGYNGVCKWFHDRDDGVHNNRASHRGAEFMVKDALPMNLVDCIVVNNNDIKNQIETWMQASNFDISVYVNTGCYF